MWQVLKTLMLGWFLRRSFGLVLGLLLLVVLLFALLLMSIGVPIGFVLLLLGIPALLLLVLIGLPKKLAFGGTGAVMAVVFTVLKLGLLFLKIALPILLIVWIVRWMCGPRNHRPWGGHPGSEPPSPPASPPPPPPHPAEPGPGTAGA
ncbi:MAG TPA: hypothetical protein VFW98_05400 [Gemmatimonadaceae bacterium]|nr:hypothetical protein [Gemmatimonadaceae bacterium]